ncbi:MAG TPA: Bax inhibitor-1/YccA family protein [Thermoanaerobaculia bacterium]|nr:Bax inhibitor-1/YccA family protein [Thermoanaerobaculia bacterium]
MTPHAAFETPLAIGAEKVTAFLRRVYGWMFAGLAVTATVSYLVIGSPQILQLIVGNPFVFFGLILVELGLVFFLSARVDKMAPQMAATLFVVYSVLNGATLSAILIAYTGTSIATTFVVTAGMFGALALYGTTTKRSLAGIGQFFFMGLIGLLLASVVGMFWKAPALQFVISVVGVLVFTGLTAWDAQRLKAMAAVTPDNQVAGRAVVGALALYLDFVNLFLFLLRFIGGRRD